MSASLPSTTKEPTFEELVDAFEVRARMLAGVGRDHVCYKTFHETRDATRSALLDYVRKLEENALTAEEAQAFFRLESDPGDLSEREIANGYSADAKLRRIARSDHEEQVRRGTGV